MATTYRSILVLLDASPDSARRTQAAIRLAREHGSQLLGLSPTGLADLPDLRTPNRELAARAARAWDVLKDRAESAAQAFRDACSAASLSNFQVVIEEADTAASTLRHARFADLVLVGEARPEAAAGRERSEAIEQVVLHNPRPTLVWPDAAPAEVTGRRILLAWDDSREATRAASDALPLLQCAEHVHALWADEGDLEAGKARERLDALYHWLHTHGVPCVAHVAQVKDGITATLRARASEIGADLVVMGAWGRPRWAERVMGGATHGMLRTLALPVLMSH
jgi:nucleotide-binding universal stress UspA family protein